MNNPTMQRQARPATQYRVMSRPAPWFTPMMSASATANRPAEAIAPAVVRRSNIFIVANIVVAVVLAATAGFPPVTRSMWHDQWWKLGIYATVVAVQTAYRMHTGNPRRRVTSTEIEGPTIIAMFWMSPWLVIAGRLVGALLGWAAIGLMSRRQRTCYLSAHAVEVIVVVWVAQQIDAENAFDGWRPLAVSFAVWAGSVVGRIATTTASGWIRTGRLASAGDEMQASAAAIAAGSVVFGLMGALIIQLSSVGVFPILVLAMLLTFSGNAIRRRKTMERALDQLAWLSARIADATPEQIEADLVQAIDAIRVCPVCVVIRSSDKGPPTWVGRVPEQTRDAVASTSDLRGWSSDRFISHTSFDGSIGVWTVDLRRGSYLLIGANRPPRQLRSLQDAVGSLVSSARTGIVKAHQLADLQADAVAEHRRARTDETTGLPNRYEAVNMIDRRLEDGLTTPLAAVMVTIEGLGHVIDVLGRDAGDAITNSFATRLRRRAPGFAARLGAKTFVAIVDGGSEVALKLAARLTEDGYTAVGEEVLTYQVTAGVAICSPDEHLTADDLLGRAGLAMGRSQASGHTVVFGNEELEYQARRTGIRMRLADAISDRSIQPAFQPQIDLQTGRLVGLEVLARWNDSELGFVSPVEFIEIAEQSRQIEALTVSMLTQALDAAQKWAALGRSVPISVNLSAQSLMWPRFLQQLIDLVAARHFADGFFTAEITESTLVAGSTAIDAIGRLRDLGARISIDDFGTGFSALSYMNTLPIHELKIDRSMVESIGDVDCPSPIVRRLIDLCAELNYSVVAEGIETQEQAGLLAQMGCEIGQGYYFARPMMEPEMTDWIVADPRFDVPLPA